MLGEVLKIRNFAGAAEKYFRAAGHSREVAKEAAEIRLRAERKAGEILDQMKQRGERAGKGRPENKCDAASHLTLPDLGVHKKQASRWQQIAAVPAPVFENYIEERNKRDLDELTTSGLMTIAKFNGKHAKGDELRKAPPPLPTGPFGVVVADPPWPYSERRPTNDSRGYPAYSGMSLEEIEALPVARIANDDAVLWLWTTNAFLEPAFRVARAWGFDYRTLLTWAKNKIGLGDWLRGQTEHCLMCSRGRPVITLTAQSTLLTAPVGEHSRKPDEFYSLVEQVCPTPHFGRVELFSREPRAGWRAWGAEAR
jgi:N6-adenosine-specific RNA methylase IME4